MSIYRLALLSFFLLKARLAEPRSAGTLTTSSGQVVPLVIVGEGWSQRIILQNVDSARRVLGTLKFYTQDGEDWDVDLVDRQKGSAFLIDLDPGQVAIFETEVRTHSQILGWAEIDQEIEGLGDMFGQITFRKQSEGRADLMTSMVLGSKAFDRVSVFFDNSNGNFTGMGFVTPDTCFVECDKPESLRVKILDLNGNTISERTIGQAPNRLFWINLQVEFPETAGAAGVFVVEVVERFSVRLTGFSLQFAGNGAFTAITPFED